MDSDKMRKGILPGIIAGYLFLAYFGAGKTNPFATTVANDAGALTTKIEMTMGNGMLDIVGGAIGAGAFTGFIIHIVISIIIGALFTGVFLNYVDFGSSMMNIIVGGLIYGLIWWIVGWKVILPAVEGAAILQLSAGPSFFGHIMYGQVLAFFVVGSSGDDYFEDSLPGNGGGCVYFPLCVACGNWNDCSKDCLGCRQPSF